MAFPAEARPSGCAYSPPRFTSETPGGGYQTGDALVGDVVFVGLLNGSDPLPGWTVDPDRQWMFRVVTESGMQPWPGYSYRVCR